MRVINVGIDAEQPLKDGSDDLYKLAREWHANLDSSRTRWHVECREDEQMGI